VLLTFVLKRIALAVPLALGIATLVFVLLESAPGSPVDLMLGDRPVPPEVRRELERIYDGPLVERYFEWLRAVFLEGNLGWSHSRSRPVTRAIADALPPTLLLSGAALAVHLFVGIGLGVWAARRRRRAGDAISLFGLVLYAMPTFWLGMMAILLFADVIKIFPPSSLRSVGADEWGTLRRLADLLWHVALPAGVLGLSSAAGLARFVRAGLLETLGQEFVRAARARGIAGRALVLRHALRNAVLPVINLLGMSLPVLVSGTLVIEVVFAWPGMGRLTYDAIRAQDAPTVLATTLLAAAMVIIGNLLADVGMALADPRIRLGGGEDTR
jgi:peptide/nickel transport system permease protein